MRKLILGIVIIVLTACQAKDLSKKEIEGLWCNEFNHCIYFQESKCFLDYAKIQEYKFISENEIEIISPLNPIIYEVVIKNEILQIRNTKHNPFRSYYKQEKKNNKQIEELYFSQDSGMSKFEIYLNKNGKGIIEIDYHLKIEPGKYIAEVPLEIIDFISELVNQMQLEIPKNLNGRIISDTQEWGMKIKTDKENYLYHNYSAINKNHNNLAFLMDKLPFILDLKREENKIQLDEIRKYRINEFERNLKENELHIDRNH